MLIVIILNKFSTVLFLFKKENLRFFAIHYHVSPNPVTRLSELQYSSFCFLSLHCNLNPGDSYIFLSPFYTMSHITSKSLDLEILGELWNKVSSLSNTSLFYNFLFLSLNWDSTWESRVWRRRRRRRIFSNRHL